MTQEQLVSSNPIVKKIAEGKANPEMLELLLAKTLPLTGEEYLESLAFLLRHDNLKARAMALLKSIPEATKLSYLGKKNANHRAAYFLLLEALNQKHDKAISQAIHNQALPHEFLVKIAEKGDANMLEMVMDNQTKLIAYPVIMEAMEKNPETTNFIRGKIKEIQNYYLQQDQTEEIPAGEVLDNIKEVIAQEEAEEDGSLDDLQEIAVEEKALTALQKINHMNISERVKLAFSGSKTHRMILIKDPNKIVAAAVIESPKITVDEVIMLAKNRSIASDIIAKISGNREWIKNYTVILELTHNPKTPVKRALSFINRLHLRDLKLLSNNKNTSPVIRELAANLFSQRTRTAKKK